MFDSLDSLKKMERVNVDEMVREIGRWDSLQDVAEAGKAAVRKIHYLFEEEQSFNQETTLCGKAIQRYINIARSKGYSVEMHYVGLSSVDIAKERVAHRVSVGGHGIPEKYIEKDE